MDTSRHRLQKGMTDIKNLMIDIAHASHHVDHLAKAVEAKKLPKSLTVEPRMMLLHADEEVEREWKEQTRQNTIGYISMAKRHYTRLIAQKTEAITDIQKTVSEVISDASLTEKQEGSQRLL